MILFKEAFQPQDVPKRLAEDGLRPICREHGRTGATVHRTWPWSEPRRRTIGRMGSDC